MFVIGATAGTQGTKAEVFAQIMGMDPKIFNSLGPYIPPQRVPEDQGSNPSEPASSWGRYRSRSADQRGRGGK
eukprot:2711761-Heterocapsa_arctica.AAC.1